VLRGLRVQTENRWLLGMVVHQGRKLVADLKDREGRFELMTTSSKEKLLQSRDPSDVTKFVSMRGVLTRWIPNM
jgi:hypothetical protein